MDNVMKMMKNSHDQCCGCFACCNICPVDAIHMKVDREGFWYPAVDESECIHCGRCVQVCQIDNHKKADKSIETEVYACMNSNRDERISSSSGGVFVVLARYVIERGGYVFGSAFDQGMRLRHSCASTMDECRTMMGSKYLQSQIGSTYSEAKEILEQGKMVLFVGTPCQIHGLKLFLGKGYDNLITADLACHGVPSSAVFKKYIADLERKNHAAVVSFNFRSKKEGWGNNSCLDESIDLRMKSGTEGTNPIFGTVNREKFLISYELTNQSTRSLGQIIKPFVPKERLSRQIRMKLIKPIEQAVKGKFRKKENRISWVNYALEVTFSNGKTVRIPHKSSIYMKGFISNLYLRPSCHCCTNKEGNKFSDLTLADYWGVGGMDPDMDDDVGTSVVLVHTSRGKELLQVVSQNLRLKKAELAYVISRNPSLKFPASENPNRELFFSDFSK